MSSIRVIRRVDLVAIDRRDERLVQRLDAAVRDRVGLVLDLLDALGLSVEVSASRPSPERPDSPRRSSAPAPRSARRRKRRGEGGAWARVYITRAAARATTPRRAQPAIRHPDFYFAQPVTASTAGVKTSSAFTNRSWVLTGRATSRARCRRRFPAGRDGDPACAISARLRFKVDRLMPRSAAARVRLRPHASRTRRMCARSMSARRMGRSQVGVLVRISGGRGQAQWFRRGSR